MNNFSKFSYGVRALGVGALALVMTYAIADEIGIVDGVKNQINKVKDFKKKRQTNKDMQMIIDKGPVDDIYYKECFRGNN